MPEEKENGGTDMKNYEAADIINIALVGRGGEGKTTMIETMLNNAGLTDRIGKVEDGNTVTDFDPEEIERGFSIMSALAPIEWKGKKINFIDAPGKFDFIGETTEAYYLADCALIFTSSISGVGVGSEKAYKYLKKHNKPMAVVINGIDKDNANFTSAFDDVKVKFGTPATVMQLPMMKGEKLYGYVDIFAGKAYEYTENAGLKEVPIPEELEADFEMYHEQMVENAAQNDETLMDKYLEGEEISPEEIEKGLYEGILTLDVIPVFAASALKNRGVLALMDAIVTYMPTADKGQPFLAKAGDEEVEVPVSKDGEFAAQVLKTIADPFLGKINIIKVIRGELTASTAVFNINSGKQEKFSSINIMRGKKLEAVTKLSAGDIGAIPKLQFTKTGDTLCTPASKLEFEPIEFGEPCISLAVTAKKQGEEEKVFAGLHRLEEEDPTFTVTSNPETGDTLVNGMGERHLDVICKKLKNKFGVDAVLKEPRVAYRETIKKAASAEGKHKKQSGGSGQFGVVQIKFEPIYDGPEFEFVNAIVGGVVPKEYVPAVEKGLVESMKTGVLAGYPMVNIRATLFDGKYHPVDSKEVAFKSAARLAYKAACAEANPVILEPIGKAHVIVPNDFTGDIMGDLNKRRGRVLGMHPCEDGVDVEAEVPMSEMVKYATDLRSMTQGRGSFTIKFERYEELPGNIAAKVIEQAKKDMEEE